jgi:hypothetical protein
MPKKKEPVNPNRKPLKWVIKCKCYGIGKFDLVFDNEADFESNLDERFHRMQQCYRTEVYYDDESVEKVSYPCYG